MVDLAARAGEVASVLEILRHRGPVWPDLAKMVLKVPALDCVRAPPAEKGISAWRAHRVLRVRETEEQPARRQRVQVWPGLQNVGAENGF